MRHNQVQKQLRHRETKDRKKQDAPRDFIFLENSDCKTRSRGKIKYVGGQNKERFVDLGVYGLWKVPRN